MNKKIKKYGMYKKPAISKKKIHINFFSSANSINSSILGSNEPVTLVQWGPNGSYIPCMG